MKRPMALIVHGGAGGAPAPARAGRIRAKLAAVLAEAYARLGDSALEAVVTAVRLLEDDPDFNAGTGARLQSDGAARLSASVMDGTAGRFAGVINLENIRNPVLVARLLLKEKDRVLAGEGAFKFALEHGFSAADTRTPEAVERWKKGLGKGSDTVGACALDARGNLASATSTGGRGLERPGRVSDSATPAGNFADGWSAVSATGTGEEILEEGLAVRLVTRAGDGSGIKTAFARTFREVARRRKGMGAIGVDRQGRLAWGKSTPALFFAWKKGNKTGSF